MTTTRRAAVVAALLLLVAAAGFLFLRRGSDTPQVAFPTTTAATAATTTTTTTGTVTTATTVADPTGTVTEPDEPATTTGTVTATTTVTVTETDEAATTTTTAVPAVTVPIPDEPDEWWTYNPELEWPVTDRDRLATENVYPHTMVSASAQVANLVDQFWSWYMAWGHRQGPALDLHQPDHREWLAGDAVDQLMYIHHRFWQQRLPVWDDVWNREFATARSQQRNKLIYLDSLGELDQSAYGSVGPPTLLYNPADEATVWRYWGPIVRPVPDPTAPRRAGALLLPDDISSACGPRPEGVVLPVVDWKCVHLGPAEGTALGDWDAGWYYDIPHEHAAWYVGTPESDGLFRYDPDRHGAPTSPYTVDGGWLAYLPATVADGASRADVQDALKPYRPEGFPDDPDAYRQMWRHDVGGGSWHKEMGQLVLLVPAAELVAWLEADGYDPQQMFARGWPNPEEERLIRNTWGKDWDRDNPADWRNRLADGVGWLEQGVEIGDSGNLAADIEAAIHISAWMDWAYRVRLAGGRFPRDQVLGWWEPSVLAPGLTISAQGVADAAFGHRPDGWTTKEGLWQGLYHQALADGYHPDAATGRLTHPALAPELAVWKEWAAAGEAERLLGFQAADGDLGPAPGDTWIPWYPEGMVPLENHYLRPEHAVAHWETVVDWWPDSGLEVPVHLPDRSTAFTVAGPYVAEAGGHLFETCLWATGGLFAAWSLPHPELEDASQNVTWIVRGIADRSGRVVKLADPVNRPCINAISRWQHEGNIPNSHGGLPTFEEHLDFVRTPLPAVKVEHAYDPAAGLWTTADGYRVLVPSQLRKNSISEHEADWIELVANAANVAGTAPDAVLEPSYQDWQQWETDAIETARVNHRERDLPLSHHRFVPSERERQRQGWAEYATDVFGDLGGAELDTPARYTDWLLSSARTWPEGLLRSTYRTVSQHRQPGDTHWLYNDGTAVDVDTWALPASEWERWAARHEAGTLHAGVVITPHYVRHRETDRTIPAGHISVHTGNDWSWANVELLDGSVTADGAVYDTDTWTVYLTSCMEEGFPVFTSERRWVDAGLFSGFAPEASDVPVWTWPGALSYGPDSGRLGQPRSDWPRWTWQNHPDIYLRSALRVGKLPPADCAGIAAGRYTPDETHPIVGAGNYPDWMSTVGDSPPKEWFDTDDPFDR